MTIRLHEPHEYDEIVVADLSIPELTAAIAAIEATWNGVDQAPAVELLHLRRTLRYQLRDSIGCCGEPSRLDVECWNDNGVKTHEYFVLNCPLDGKPCKHAMAGFGVPDVALLNSVLTEMENLACPINQT